MRLSGFFTIIAFALTVAAISCGSQSAPAPAPEPSRTLSDGEQQLVAAGRIFGLHLFQHTLAEQPGQNVIISPLSISMVLTMARNGATGQTREAMTSALAFTSLDDSITNQSFASLTALLTGLDSAVRIDIANSIWHRTDFSVKEPFLRNNRAFFDARVEGLDFNKPSAAASINNWVSEVTDGKIEQIVPADIDPLTMLFLINAVYFDGVWTTKFDPDSTAQAPFTTETDGEVIVSMMSLDGTFAYSHSDLCQAVDIPYGNGYYRMTVLLPHEGILTDSLATTLSEDKWQEITESLATGPGHLFMPRFSLQFEAVLNASLSAMGMASAFNPSLAEFDDIADNNDLHISQVLHKTFIEVDEEGTEAAAATSVTVGITSVGPDKFTVRLDRPFLFAISDGHSGALLFLGRIANPVAAI